MSIMRKYHNHATWVAAFLLLGFSTACNDPDKNSNSIQNTIPLSSASSFVVLAGSTVTNAGPTVITGGDLGLSPGSSVTGFGPGTLTPPAVMHIMDAAAAQAQLDLTVAYNNAAGLPGGASLPGDLSGLTFTPGVYTNASSVLYPPATSLSMPQRECCFHLPNWFHADYVGIHSSCSCRGRSGQERLLASGQFSHSGNQLRLHGNHHGAAIHHAEYQRNSYRQSGGSQWRGHSGQQHYYRALRRCRRSASRKQDFAFLKSGGIFACHFTRRLSVGLLRC